MVVNFFEIFFLNFFIVLFNFLKACISNNIVGESKTREWLHCWNYPFPPTNSSRHRHYLLC